MRKVKLQMQVSVDGFVAGPNGEMDWMVWNWDDQVKNHAYQLTESSDTVLIGRKAAQEMAGYWPAVPDNKDSSDEDLYMADKMNNWAKVVFSNTIRVLDWTNARVTADDPARIVAELKQQPGMEIIVYGGADFVSNLIAANLIDEYHLFVNPAAIGSGKSIFGKLSGNVKLKRIQSIAGESGIIVQTYEPVRAE